MYDGSGQQEVLIEMLAGDGEDLTISVSDVDSPDCSASETITTTPTCPDCSLVVTAEPSFCDDGSYSLVLNVTYNSVGSQGFSYSIGDTPPVTVAYDGSGSQSIEIDGFLANQEEVTVTVQDIEDANCAASTTYTACLACELDLNLVISDCNEEGTYDVILMVEYMNVENSEGLTYSIVDANQETVAEGTLTYNGSGEQGYMIPNIPTTDFLDMTVTISDLGNDECMVVKSYTAPNCAELLACNLNSAGICELTLLEGLKKAAIEACPTQGILANAIGSFLVSNEYEIVYMLYTDIFDPYGSIVFVSTDGVFPNDGSITGLPLDEVVYIVPVAILTAYNGDVVEAHNNEGASNNDCVSLGIPAEAIFLSQCGNCTMEIDNQVICGDSESNIYNIAFTISNGVAPYSITTGEGGINITGIGNNESIMVGPFSKDENYSVSVTDAEGCTEIVSSIIAPCAILPVELIEFTGEVLENGNALRWVTASEVNNDFFTLEHSMDGERFEPIAKVKGQGTSSEINVYDFLHENAPVGLSYYRLSQTDFNGNRSSYSVITLIRKAGGFKLLGIKPVPSDSEVAVSFMSSTEEEVTFSIHSVDGRLIDVQTLSSKEGVNEHTIDISAYPSGIYHLQLANGQEVINAKIMRK